MTRAGFDSLSPRVHQAGLSRLMNPRTNSTKLSELCPGLYPNISCGWMGYDVPQVEIFVQVFLPLAWVCFWDVLDTSINSEGWGYDVCFKTVCNASIALLDNWNALHTRGKSDDDKSDRGITAMAQMTELFKSRDIKTKTKQTFISSCPWPLVDYSTLDKLWHTTICSPASEAILVQSIDVDKVKI